MDAGPYGAVPIAGAGVEGAVGAMISRKRLPEVGGTSGVGRLVRLLGGHATPAEELLARKGVKGARTGAPSTKAQSA